MIRDFVSGALVLAFAAGVTICLHSPKRHVTESMRDHASVPPTQVHPIFELARTLRDKKPAQAGINCFGTTLAAFGAAGAPRYASDTELLAFLARSCIPLADKDPVTNYDVGVIFDGRPGQKDPAHSFIVIGRGIVFYKDGVEKSGGYYSGKFGPMLQDFRVGFSEEKCAELEANATVESGLPCPGVVKRYRCKDVKPIGWAALDEFEARLYSLVADREKVSPGEKAEIAARLANLAKPAAFAPASKLDEASRDLLNERLTSLETFFTFYADRKVWGETDVANFRGLARSLKDAVAGAK